MWGVSSAGRAPALHAGGQEFDPPTLHQYEDYPISKADIGFFVAQRSQHVRFMCFSYPYLNSPSELLRSGSSGEDGNNFLLEPKSRGLLMKRLFNIQFVGF